MRNTMYEWLKDVNDHECENKEISIFDDPKKDFTKRFLEEKQVAKLRILKEERHKRAYRETHKNSNSIRFQTRSIRM
jgi:hypothetical protein